jgi:FMN phosphatase YigB (HAD superfamily)
MNPKAIVFDLGGVLMDLSYLKTAEAFRKLGLKDFDTIYSQAKQSGLFDAFETGKISSGVFRKKLRDWLDPGIGDDQIDSAWNAMLLGMPAHKIELLQSLKEHYRIFLLSNTNEIHLTAVFDMMRTDHGFPDLSHLMEKQYYSCRVGMRKPDAGIFQYVLQEQGLKASEVLFIDDSIQHIEGARSVGMKAHHLKEGEDLNRLFDEQYNIRKSGKES